MRNLKPSDAAMRRERFDSNPLSAPEPPLRLEARIEDIWGLDAEPRPRPTTRLPFVRRPGSGMAMIAVSATLFVALTGGALLGPRALGQTGASPSPTASPAGESGPSAHDSHQTQFADPESWKV